MKAIILGMALAILPVAAEETKKEDVCATIGELADSIMKARQIGVPMSKAMTVAKDTDWLQEMVIKAYEQPAYQSDGMQKKAVSDFVNDYLVVCYKAVQGK